MLYDFLESNIVHGDLTSSNIMIQNTSNAPALIDFGLSSFAALVEDKAVDLYVLARSFFNSGAFEFILKGYSNGLNSKKVITRLDQGMSCIWIH